MRNFYLLRAIEYFQDGLSVFIEKPKAGQKGDKPSSIFSRLFFMSSMEAFVAIATKPLDDKVSQLFDYAGFP